MYSAWHGQIFTYVLEIFTSLFLPLTLADATVSWDTGHRLFRSSILFRSGGARRTTKVLSSNPRFRRRHLDRRVDTSTRSSRLQLESRSIPCLQLEVALSRDLGPFRRSKNRSPSTELMRFDDQMGSSFIQRFTLPFGQDSTRPRLCWLTSYNHVLQVRRRSSIRGTAGRSETRQRPANDLC